MADKMYYNQNCNLVNFLGSSLFLNFHPRLQLDQPYCLQVFAIAYLRYHHLIIYEHPHSLSLILILHSPLIRLTAHQGFPIGKYLRYKTYQVYIQYILNYPKYIYPLFLYLHIRTHSSLLQENLQRCHKIMDWSRFGTLIV